MQFSIEHEDAENSPHPLSDALTQLEQFAKFQGDEETSQWSMIELEGYLGKHANNCPDYRTVMLNYFDASGQVIPSLKEDYGSWSLLHGVRKLEMHVKNGLTLKLPAEVENFLSQACNGKVYGGHVPPNQIEAVLEAIRTEVTAKLQKLLPDPSSASSS